MTLTTERKEKAILFLWQHLLLLISLYLMTLGVVLCVKSSLGSSVISSLPFVFSLAGLISRVPEWTIGGYTIAMNFILVFCQILILRRNFDFMQLFQLVIGFVFGWLIDINMALTAGLECTTWSSQIFAQFAGCTIMGIGIGAVRLGNHAGRGHFHYRQSGDEASFRQGKDMGGYAARAACRRRLLPLFRELAMERHRRRYALRDGLRRTRGQVHRPASGLVRSRAGLCPGVPALPVRAGPPRLSPRHRIERLKVVPSSAVLEPPAPGGALPVRRRRAHCSNKSL